MASKRIIGYNYNPELQNDPNAFRCSIRNSDLEYYRIAQKDETINNGEPVQKGDYIISHDINTPRGDIRIERKISRAEFVKNKRIVIRYKPNNQMIRGVIFLVELLCNKFKL